MFDHQLILENENSLIDATESLLMDGRDVQLAHTSIFLSKSFRQGLEYMVIPFCLLDCDFKIIWCKPQSQKRSLCPGTIPHLWWCLPLGSHALETFRHGCDNPKRSSHWALLNKKFCTCEQCTLGNRHVGWPALGNTPFVSHFQLMRYMITHFDYTRY